MALPFETTKVSVQRSMELSKKLLYDVGFTGFAEERDAEENFTLTASIGIGSKKTNFTFTVNISEIEKRLSRRYNDAHKKALRIGWRSFYYQTKALTDSIKLGTISIPEAFAGNMSLIDHNGNTIKVGAMFTELALDGNFNIDAIQTKLLT